MITIYWFLIYNSRINNDFFVSFLVSAVSMTPNCSSLTCLILAMLKLLLHVHNQVLLFTVLVFPSLLLLFYALRRNSNSWSISTRFSLSIPLPLLWRVFNKVKESTVRATVPTFKSNSSYFYLSSWLVELAIKAGLWITLWLLTESLRLVTRFGRLVWPFLLKPNPSFASDFQSFIEATQQLLKFKSLTGSLCP